MASFLIWFVSPSSLIPNTHLVDSGRDIIRANPRLNRVTSRPTASAVSLINRAKFWLGPFETSRVL
jgi:hypothetical protein